MLVSAIYTFVAHRGYIERDNGGELMILGIDMKLQFTSAIQWFKGHHVNTCMRVSINVMTFEPL